MAARSPAGAVEYARETASLNRYWRPGLCLKFVRTCFNVASRYPSAERAYYATQHRHTSWPPPAGVPVWWTNGRYGHVAVSAGGGYCYSTDFIITGRVRRTRITSITNGWGQRYRGWTEDVNGVRVYQPPKAVDALSLKAVQHAARSAPRSAPHGTRLIQRALVTEGLLRRPYIPGRFGKRTRNSYGKWQARLGFKGAAANGIPGRYSLVRLGRAHRFRVAR